MTHKFNLTIKGLQEEKLDKKVFNDKFTFVNKVIHDFNEDAKLIRENEQHMKRDLFKLIHANTQIEMYNMMNAMYKEETEEKQNLRKYLTERFQQPAPTKIVSKTVIIKKKVIKSDKVFKDTENEDDEQSESEKSEYVEELVQQKCVEELDFTEIAPQILQKFENIKQVNFDVDSEKYQKDQERMKANKEFLEKRKAEDKQKELINVFEKQMNDKYIHLVKMAQVVDILKTNQEKTALKLSEVGNNFRQFKDIAKKSFADNNKVNEIAVKLDELRNAAFSNKTLNPFNRQNNKNEDMQNTLSEDKEQEDINFANKEGGYDKESEIYKSYDSDNALVIPTQNQNNLFQSNDYHISGIDKEEVVAEVERGCRDLESKLSDTISKNYEELKKMLESDKEDLRFAKEQIESELESNRTKFDTFSINIRNLDKEFTKIGKELRGDVQECFSHVTFFAYLSLDN